MDYENIKKLMEDMGNSKIDNLNIEFSDGTKISMSKEKELERQIDSTNNEITVNKVQKIVIPENIDKKENEAEENLKVIKSPMVGTFYSSNSPKDNPFVKVGDQVSQGQVLCIVEAMKLMNEIESDFDGEIVEVCVKNEDMVEYGTPLFKIKS